LIGTTIVAESPAANIPKIQIDSRPVSFLQAIDPVLVMAFVD
jgi:hypothetical protein